MDDVSDDLPDTSPAPPEGTAFFVRPEVLAMGNPFGREECVSIDLTREINPSQLADEICERTGRPSFQVLVANPEPGRHHLNRTLPDRLHVSPPVDEDVLRELIGAHEPDPDYGLTEEQREQRDLLGKLRDGKSLSPKELNRALMLVLTESK